jgi:hypothetical protein
MVQWLLIVLAAIALVGCAQRLAPPDAAGEACDEDTDCNRADGGAVVTCGVLRACIAGRCERTPLDGGAGSWIVACRDAAADAAQ